MTKPGRARKSQGEGGSPMRITQSRRQFLTMLSLTGAAGLVAAPAALAEEGPLETRTVRLEKDPGICRAPQYVAEALLRAEGFTDIRHVERASSAEINEALAQNHADFGTHYSAELLPAIEGGGAITILSGGARRLPRAVRSRGHSQHYRPEREKRRGSGPDLDPVGARL